MFGHEILPLSPPFSHSLCLNPTPGLYEVLYSVMIRNSIFYVLENTNDAGLHFIFLLVASVVHCSMWGVLHGHTENHKPGDIIIMSHLRSQMVNVIVSLRRHFICQLQPFCRLDERNFSLGWREED